MSKCIWIGTFVFYFLSSVEIHAQESSCGEISEKTCGFLSGAINRWNESYSNAPRAVSFEFSGNRESEAFRLALAGWNGEVDIPIATFDQEGEFESFSFVNFREEDTEDQYSPQIFRWAEGMESAITVQWDDQGEVFTSVALVSDSYPYVIDPMIMNDLIVEEGNSCYHLVVRWPWGTVRGEVLLDLVPKYGVGGLTCLRSAESWITIGSAPDPLVSEISYVGGKCTAKFAYALATPLAKVSANRESLSFEISGIGSRISGTRDCSAP